MTTPDVPREITVEEIDRIEWHLQLNAGSLFTSGLKRVFDTARRALSQAGGEWHGNLQQKPDYSFPVERDEVGCRYPNCECPVSFPEGFKPSIETQCPDAPLSQEFQRIRDCLDDADRLAAALSALEKERDWYAQQYREAYADNVKLRSEVERLQRCWHDSDVERHALRTRLNAAEEALEFYATMTKQCRFDYGEVARAALAQKAEGEK